MSRVTAHYYDGRTSAVREVEVDVRTGGDGRPMLLAVSGDESLGTWPLDDMPVDSGVGAAHRILDLPGGGTLEFHGRDLDSLLERVGHRPQSHWVDRLESRWSVALGALLASAVALWAFTQYGIPMLATRAAFAIPASVGERIEDEGIDLADRDLLDPSELTPERRRELTAEFDGVVADLGFEAQPTLIFRRSPKLGANAFALPGGTVLVTDDLVEMARNDDELRAVFAHELGHVRSRHAMRLLLQNSATAVLMVGLLGDVTAASSLAASVPTVLAHAAYSRDFEREADDCARAWMERAGVPPERLGDLLERLERRYGSGWSYLSTHPPLRERLRR